MSRIAKKTITVIPGVKVESDKHNVVVQGSKGKLSRSFSTDINIVIEGDQIKIKGDFEKKRTRAQAGLALALIDNMIKGVNQSFTKSLEIIGVGYRAQIQGNNLNLQLGFSHPIVLTIPEGIKIQTPKPTQIVVEGIDKEKVGDVTAGIRAIFPPEPYKGKGIRYQGEHVRRKIGKAVAK